MISCARGKVQFHSLALRRCFASSSRIQSGLDVTAHERRTDASFLRKPVGTKAARITEPVYLEMSTSLRPNSSVQSQEHIAVLDPSVFRHPIRRDILHLCVVHYLDSLRQGSASTKTRGEVRGSGRKIRPQKGSGKARLGDGQSPMLRGGGVAFGPKPRDFSTKLPRKVIEMGMRVALSSKVADQRLGVVQKFDWVRGKTKGLAARIDTLGWRKTLFVTGEDHFPVGMERASRNVPQVGTTTAQHLKIYDLLKWQRVVMDVSAVKWFEQNLGKSTESNPNIL